MAMAKAAPSSSAVQPSPIRIFSNCFSLGWKPGASGFYPSDRSIMVNDFQLM